MKRLLTRLAVPALLFMPGFICVTLAQDDEKVAPPVSGALYFNAWTLEKEIIVRLPELQESLGLELTAETRLDSARREEIARDATAFLLSRCPLTIDGQPVAVEAEITHFIEPDPSEFTTIDPAAVIPAREATLRVLFVATLPRLDCLVGLRWDLFPGSGSPVEISVVDLLGSRPFPVSPDAPEISVQGRFPRDARSAPEPPPAPPALTLAVPWLSILLVLFSLPVAIAIFRSESTRGKRVALLLILVGSAAVARERVFFTIAHPTARDQQLDDDERRLVVDRLLRGVYHAFDYSDQSQRYDILEQVAGKEALTDIYLEITRTLEQRKRDGSRVRVHDLSVVNARSSPLDGRRGFAADCEWEASGKVGHWGHLHDRLNFYRATLTIEPIESSWKITGLTFQARERRESPGE